MATKIPWVKNPNGSQGITLNPITGCLNHVDGKCKGGGFPCYAYRLAHGRLRTRYLANTNIAPVVIPYSERQYDGWEKQKIIGRALSDPFYPRFWPERLDEIPITGHGKPKGIFVCDMSDLFGIGIPEQWTREVLEQCKEFSSHRFYLLTKQPQNLAKWSPFPDNCWVGVTACNDDMFCDAIFWLKKIEAKVKYISIEPFLGRIDVNPLLWPEVYLKDAGIAWLIIGACTGTKPEMLKLIERYPSLTLMKFGSKWSAQPSIEWVEEIVKVCDKAGIPVFLKDNLEPLLPVDLPFYKPAKVSTPTAIELVATVWKIRQELPQ